MKHLLGIPVILPVLIDLETRFHGDFPATDRAKPLLLPEQFCQYLPALQTVSHFLCLAFFKVFPVIRVKRVGTVPNLFEADDIRIDSINQTDVYYFPVALFLLCGKGKCPVSIANTVKILRGYLWSAFLGMPAFAPGPQTFEDLKIQIFKGHSGHIEALVIDPSAYHGVQLANQPFLFYCGILFYRGPDFVQYPLDIFLGWLDQQFSFVFADIAPQEVKAVINVSNDRLLR